MEKGAPGLASIEQEAPGGGGNAAHPKPFSPQSCGVKKLMRRIRAEETGVLTGVSLQDSQQIA